MEGFYFKDCEVKEIVRVKTVRDCKKPWTPWLSTLIHGCLYGFISGQEI